MATTTRSTSYNILFAIDKNDMVARSPFVRKAVVGALLLVIISLSLLASTLPEMFITSGRKMTWSLLADLGRQAGVFFNPHLVYSIPTEMNSPNKSPTNFHEEACDRFFSLANCSQQLDARDKRHRWPVLNSTDNFYDFRRVLLVLHYNTPNYESAAKVFALYRKIFAKIVFCGPEVNETGFWPFWPSTRENNTAFSLSPNESKFFAFGKYIGTHTLNPYICLPLALEKEPGDYDGALVMSDDLVANYWNFKAIGKSLEKNWLLKLPGDSAFDIDSTHFCVKKSSNNSVDCYPGVGYWMWPGYNKAEILQFYEHLTMLANDSTSFTDSFIPDWNSTQWTNYWRQVKENLTNVTGGERRLLGASGDCFYVAKKYFRNAVPLLRLLGSHHVFLEIGVVTALRPTTPLDDIQLLSFEAQDWGQGTIRSHPFIDAYKMSYEVVHPFKMSNVNGYFQFENETNLATMMKKNPVDISTSCVYCNLIRFATAYADLFDRKIVVN